ncbi:hypothetical protein D3C80_1856750 [compost metagenome]
MARQRAAAHQAGGEEGEPKALPDVMGGAVDSLRGVARPLAADGPVQGEHGLSRAGGVQAEVGLGDLRA